MTTPAPGHVPRVAFIVASAEGARWAFEQLRELRDRHGYEVTAVLSGDKGDLVDRFLTAGIPIHSADFDFTSSVDLLSLPRKVVALTRLLRRERFDVVQTHLFHSMVLGRIAAWFADVPARFSMIAGPFHLEAYTPRWIDRYTRWIDTKTIASCEYSRALYLQMGVPKRHLALVYYGSDEARFDPAKVVPARLREEYRWSADTPLIGMVAYFYPELPHSRWIPPAVQGRAVKSQEDFIRAVPLVLTEFPEAKFLLVGSGWETGGKAYMRRMQELVAQLALEKSITFTGFRTDVPAVLAAIDVAVQPSLSENLGGSIESLLMSRPTVVTRVGGLVDTIIDGETGILVEPSNPASLANGILTMLREPERAKQYGRAGRERMLSRFTLRHTGNDLAELYAEALAKRRVGYRKPVMCFHVLVGMVLCLAIASRYVLLDVIALRFCDRLRARWQRTYDDDGAPHAV
jgi:glycosyltransferase involved in cell wall biosynthesis